MSTSHAETPLTYDQRRVLAQLDDVWQTAREIEAGLPYMHHRVFLGHLRSLRRRGLATLRRSAAHGRWEYATTEAGEAALSR